MWGKAAEKMTIRNEAARLFFAVSALILVGMLSAPAGNLGSKPVEISPAKLMSSEPKLQPKSKNAIKLVERKTARKNLVKKS